MGVVGKAILERRLTRSVLVLMAVGIAILGRSALEKLFGPGFPTYISLYPVVMAAAVLAGFWQGLLATVAAGLATDYWILPPQGHLKFGHSTEMVALAIFLSLGVSLSLLAEAYRRNRRKATAYDKQALRESESRFRSLFYNSLDAMFLTVPDGTILAANPSACALFGMSEAELCRAGRQGITDPDDPCMVASLEERERTGKARAELACIRKDGTRFTAEVSSVILEGLHRQSFVVLRDVTERKRAEETLRLSEEKFARAFSGNPAAIVLTRFKDNRFLDVNDTWVAMSGYTREEAIGNSATAMNLWPTEEAAEWFSRELREKGSVRAWEQDFLNKSGETFTAQLSAQVLTVSGEELVLSTLIDITARKRAEKALRETEDRFRVFFENVGVGAAEVDPGGRFLQVNQRLCQMTGYSREELVGMNAAVLTHPEDRDRELAQLRLYAGGKSPIHDIEKRSIRKDGTVTWVHVTSALVRDADGAILRSVGIIQDITERKQAEAALIRAEKLSSVGHMAASIAHEINNPLAAVTNTLYLAQRYLNQPDLARAYLEKADDELKRISHITRQTLGFYRDSAAPSSVSLNAVLDSAVELLRGKVKGAQIERQYEGDFRITAVEGELRQVFSNLIDNSLEALGEEGIVKIRISKAYSLGEGQQRIRVTIADNGEGISEATLSRIFEPLFTTKGSTGSGLGLWVSQRLVQKHDGSIRVRSCPSGSRKGTTFSILLPVNAADAPADSAGATDFTTADEVRSSTSAAGGGTVGKNTSMVGDSSRR